MSGQLLAQGISQFGQGVASGIEQYGARKEKEQNILAEANGLGKALFSTFKGMEDAGLIPEGSHTAQIQKIRESLSPKEAVVALRTLAQTMGGIMEMGMQAKKEQTEKARQAQIGKVMAILSQIPDLPSQVRFATANLDPETASRVITSLSGAFKATEPKEAKAPVVHTIKQTGQNGETYDVSIEYAPDGTRTEVGRVRTDVQPGYRPAANGAVAPIPGGQQDPTTLGTQANVSVEKARAEATKEKLAQSKFLAAAESAKNDLLTAKEFVKKARTLSRAGTGGPIGGTLGWFGQDNEQLQSSLSAIKNILALDKMAELKSLSPSGATGFGQQSDKELGVMQERLGKLSSLSNEKVTQETLDQIDAMLDRRLKSFNPQAAFTSDDELLKQYGL
jgi:hypothetical protein